VGSLRKIFHFSLRDFFPKSLFKRAFLIIGLPLILVQIVFTVVFLDRYLDSVTKSLAGNIARTAKVITDVHQKNPQLSKDISDEMGVFSEFHKNQFIKKIDSTPLEAWEDHFLKNALEDALERPYILTTSRDVLSVHIQTDKGVMTLSVLRKKLMSRMTILVFIWVFGASIIFLIIASIFMKNQVRPIQRLAEAAENFGKGLDMADFKVSGALEVRQAAKAFNQMRERIRRQITQRTDMLAGISHDLRTPLTRMKLELAMMPKNSKLEEIKSDILEMEILINEYLSFVKGNGQEKKSICSLKNLLNESVLTLKSKPLKLSILQITPIKFSLRPNSFKRAIKNLLENANRYASQATLKAYKKEDHIYIILDDNGAGIPTGKRKEVFKPFFRLEKSRNAKTGGTGLGLSISQDIIHAHGGRIILGNSPLGGLRVTIKIPL
jgi:two-component system osmolarity sensor histidine kinase EnvZ